VESLDDVIAKFDDSLPLKRAWTIPSDSYTDRRVEELERRTASVPQAARARSACGSASVIGEQW
jgi:hypothetical protein